jgi:hypothetical protein
MLLRFIQKIFVSGERRLRKDLSVILNLKESCNNKKVLKLLVETILSNHDKVIQDVVFPIISKAQLELIR